MHVSRVNLATEQEERGEWAAQTTRCTAYDSFQHTTVHLAIFSSASSARAKHSCTVDMLSFLERVLLVFAEEHLPLFLSFF